jgi:hypothetical protein
MRAAIGAGLLCLVGLCLAACTSQTPYQSPGTYADPAKYCDAVVTIDKPDKRYTGPAVPEWMARALRNETGASPTAPLDPFRQALWRCADGYVMACTVGANIPCDSKGDTSKVPTKGAEAYCRDNLNSETVPAVATGHATVYEWRCRDGKAVVVDQVLPLDGQGYPSVFWYKVTPTDGGPS